MIKYQQIMQEKVQFCVGGEVDDSLNVGCFVIRNKETGEYDRVMMDREKNEIIFDTKSLEDLGFHIDKLKLIKRFKK